MTRHEHRYQYEEGPMKGLICRTVTPESIERAKAAANEERWELFVRTGLLVGQDGRIVWTGR